MRGNRCIARIRPVFHRLWAWRFAVLRETMHDSRINSAAHGDGLSNIEAWIFGAERSVTRPTRQQPTSSRTQLAGLSAAATLKHGGSRAADSKLGRIRDLPFVCGLPRRDLLPPPTAAAEVGEAARKPNPDLRGT